VCPYEVALCSLGHNWFHNVRAVAMKPSADFLLAYMRLSYGQPKTQGLYSCVFTNNPYYVWRDPIAEWYVVRYGHGTQPPSTLEYLITADADDLYGIDRQPSGVYVVHYIHDGTRQTMTSNDGGQTWA